MTLTSWIYMGTVWVAIIALNVFCFSRIFSKKKKTDNNTDTEEW